MTSMYTVCPKCALTLAVTAGDLRVAQGHVRCGRCSHVFNAMTRLTSGERLAAGVHEEEEPVPEGALEFNADATQVFAEPTPSPKWTPTGTYRGLAFRNDDADDAHAEEPLEIELGNEALYSATLETPILKAPEDETMTRPMPAPRARAQAGAAVQRTAGIDPSVPVTAEVWKPRKVRMPALDNDLALETTQQMPAISRDPAPPRSPGRKQTVIAEQTVEVVRPPRTAPAPRVEPGVAALAAPPRSSGPVVPWILGSGLLSVLLLLQFVHHYRNDLAASTALNGPLTRFYGLFGVRLTPRWDLSKYDVRQLGASGDSGGRAGEITVRASIKNSARRAQPLPLLRVTLQDRFGNRIAARDVPPSAYLPSLGTAKLNAGQRIDVQMTFMDPGPNAVGFEIAPCLPVPGGGTACE